MANSLLDQINAELISIRAKLGASPQITVATQLATMKTAIDLVEDSGDAGTGIGPLSSMEGAQTLTAWFVAAITTETP